MLVYGSGGPNVRSERRDFVHMSHTWTVLVFLCFYLVHKSHIDRIVLSHLVSSPLPR